MKRSHEGELVQDAKKTKQNDQSEDGFGVVLKLGDDNEHLQSLLRSQMSNFCTRYDLLLENETRYDRSHMFDFDSFQYCPKLNCLVLFSIRNYQFDVFDLKTKSIINTIDAPYMVPYSTFCVIEKDQALVYAKYVSEDDPLLNSIVKLSLKNDVIWETPNLKVEEEEDLHIAYHSKLDMLVAGNDSKVIKLDATTGSILNEMEVEENGAPLHIVSVYIDMFDKLFIAGKTDNGSIVIQIFKQDTITLDHCVDLNVEVPSDWKLISVLDEHIIVDHFGSTYNITSGAALGDLVGNISCATVKYNKMFVLSRYSIDSYELVSYNIMIEKKSFQCPLGKSECDDIRRLGGTIPTMFRKLRNMNDLSSFFLSINWNPDQNYVLHDENLKNDFIVLSKNPITGYFDDKDDDIKLTCCMIGRGTQSEIYFRFKDSKLMIELKNGKTINMTINEFFSKLEKVDVQHFTKNQIKFWALINYSKIVDQLSEQDLTNQLASYYQAVTIGNLYEHTKRGLILSLLESLGLGTIRIYGKDYLKADLLLACLSTLNANFRSDFLCIDVEEMDD